MKMTEKLLQKKERIGEEAEGRAEWNDHSVRSRPGVNYARTTTIELSLNDSNMYM